MEEDIIEKLADNEHNRWTNWQKYVHSKCIRNQDGSLTIPKEYVEHWEYEINTKYKDLQENIKESDRKEVIQVLKILDYENLIARYKELEKQMGKDLDVVYINGVYDERDKWRSKIKEKIEEYNKQRQKAKTEKINNMFVNYIDCLQELLES